MRYYIGIDGGGTKTDMCLADAQGSLLAGIHGGTASYKQIGTEGVIALLRKGIDGLMEQAGIKKGPGNQFSTCFGMPMYGECRTYDSILEREIERHFPYFHIQIVNDVEVGWAGSLGLEPGINIVAGTGSIAYGRNEAGESARAGGWSEFFSDEGSCRWLGLKTMELFTKQADGRRPRGPLYRMVREEFSLANDYDVIEKIEEEYVPYRDQLASLQLLLKGAALEGDGEARKIYGEAAAELGLMVKSVFEQLGMGPGTRVSYAGGLFKAGPLIGEPFANVLRPLGVILEKPLHTPVEGALLLAKNFGKPTGGERRCI